MQSIMLNAGSSDVLIGTVRAAGILGVSPRTIRRMLERGELTGTKIGKKLWKIWRSSVLKKLP